MSACVTVYVPTQVSEPPTATLSPLVWLPGVPASQSRSDSIGSETDTPVNVTLPVLVSTMV